ncbi:MAG: hypothetical protein ABSC19_08570 [Syntrophorhabdales bacterium]|jgi:hypothetical protein
MKRALPLILLCILAFVFLGQTLAQGSAGTGPEWSKEVFMNQLSTAKEMTFTGQVVAHDPLCHCLVVNTPKGDLTLMDDYAKFMEEYNEAKGLKIGSRVTGTYKTVNHIHYLTSISYATK